MDTKKVEDDSVIILVSQEGTEFQIRKSVLAPSGYINGVLECPDIIPLPMIAEKTLGKVIKFLEHLAEGNPPPEIERPIRSDNIRDLVSEWMADFILNINDDELNDLSEAANVLDIKSLFDLSCA